MKLWLLRPARYEDEEFWLETRDRIDGNPWSPWYDKVFGLVVRAGTEQEARHIAAKYDPDLADAWRDPKHSTCVDLTPDGAPGVIMSDVHHS